MKRARAFWLWVLLICSASSMADQRIIVIGDSLSAHLHCWPNELRLANPELNIQLIARSGRTIRDFSLPRDMRNVSKKDVVIYFLGTNDAFLGHRKRFVMETFVSHMVFLQERGFRIIVLLPPIASSLMPNIQDVRDVITGQSLRLNIEHHDLEFWDEAMTRDGIHPTTELSRLVAGYVYYLLTLDPEQPSTTD